MTTTDSKEKATDRRRITILQTARRIFLSTNLADANMVDIAKQAGISRRTLYRYYPSKEEIAFAVELEIFRDLFTMYRDTTSGLSGTGYEKLNAIISLAPAIVVRFRDELRFTGEFDNYFTMDFSRREEWGRLIEIVISIEGFITNIILQGIEDGSIRRDIDPHITFTAVSNTLFSMSQRVVIWQEHYRRDLHIEPEELVGELCELILRSIKG